MRKQENTEEPSDCDKSLISVKEKGKGRKLGRKCLILQHNSKEVSTRLMGNP